MVTAERWEIKELVHQAREGLKLRRREVLVAVETEEGCFAPQQHTDADSFLNLAGQTNGIDAVCRALAKHDDRAFVGVLHSNGVAVVGFRPRPHKKRLPQLVTSQLIAKAIYGCRCSEVYCVKLKSDFELKPFRPAVYSAKEFIRRTAGCKCRLPKLAELKNGIHIAIFHSTGIFVARI